MKIVQVTDTHIRGDATMVHWGYRPHASLAAVLEAVRSDHSDADLLICTGDCVHAFPEEPDAAFRGGEVGGYKVFHGLLSGACPPTALLHALPGNHDNRQQLSAAFPQSTHTACEGGGGPALPPSPPGVHCFGAILKGWLLLGCDSQTGPPTEPHSHGGLGEEQRRWLQSCLRTCPDLPAIIFMHHPPVRDSSSFDPIELPKLEQVLREHRDQIQAVVAGHIHSDFTAQLCGGDGPRLHTCPSSVFQFHVDRSGKVSEQDFESSPGFRVINCLGGSIDWSDTRKPSVVRPPMPATAQLSKLIHGPRMARVPGSAPKLSPTAGVVDPAPPGPGPTAVHRLSAADVHRFEEDGFVLVRQVFSPKQVALLSAVARADPVSVVKPARQPLNGQKRCGRGGAVWGGLTWDVTAVITRRT
jgi:Icc protein